MRIAQGAATPQSKVDCAALWSPSSHIEAIAAVRRKMCGDTLNKTRALSPPPIVQLRPDCGPRGVAWRGTSPLSALRSVLRVEMLHYYTTITRKLEGTRRSVCHRYSHHRFAMLHSAADSRIHCCLRAIMLPPTARTTSASIAKFTPQTTSSGAAEDRECGQ